MFSDRSRYYMGHKGRWLRNSRLGGLYSPWTGP
jgi:hypothetical protein